MIEAIGVPRAERVLGLISRTSEPTIDTGILAKEYENLRERTQNRHSFINSQGQLAITDDQANLLLVPEGKYNHLIWEEFNRAFLDLELRLEDYGISPHISLSHSLQDVFSQVSILIGGFETSKKEAYNVSKIVLLLHFLDDFVETWGWSGEKFKDHWLRRPREKISLPDKSIPPVILDLLDSLQSEMLSSLLNANEKSKSNNSSFRRDFLRRKEVLGTAIVRMLMGLDFFQNGRELELAEQSWKIHSRFLRSKLPQGSEVKNIISQLDPLFVAFSVNSLSEALHIALPLSSKLAYSSYEESIYLSLILGPIFHGHNEKIEIDLGENSYDFQVDSIGVERNLKLLSERFTRLSPERQEAIRIILRRALYSMGKVLGMKTKETYSKYFDLQ